MRQDEEKDRKVEAPKQERKKDKTEQKAADKMYCADVCSPVAALRIAVTATSSIQRHENTQKSNV